MTFFNKISRFYININFLDLFNFINFNINKSILLENKIKKLFSINNFILVNQGRVGLYLILKLLRKNFPIKQTILISPYTLTEVINCINYSKFKIQFIDIDIRTGLPKLQELQSQIKKNKKISAVLLTHLFTKKNAFVTIKNLLIKKKIMLINDHAINLGCKFNNKLFGSESNFSFYSFNYQKNLSTINGGMVICKNKNDYEQLKAFNENLVEPGILRYIKKIIFLLVVSNALCNRYVYNLFTFQILKKFLYKVKFLSSIIYPNFEKKIRYDITCDYNFKFNRKLSYFGLRSANTFIKRNNHRIVISKKYFDIFKKIRFIKDLAADTLSTKLEYPVLIKKNYKNKLVNFLFDRGFEVRAYWYSNTSKKNIYKNCNILQKKILCFPTHEKINDKYLLSLENSLQEFASIIKN